MNKFCQLFSCQIPSHHLEATVCSEICVRAGQRNTAMWNPFHSHLAGSLQIGSSYVTVLWTEMTSYIKIRWVPDLPYTECAAHHCLNIGAPTPCMGVCHQALILSRSQCSIQLVMGGCVAWLGAWVAMVSVWQSLDSLKKDWLHIHPIVHFDGCHKYTLHRM